MVIERSQALPGTPSREGHGMLDAVLCGAVALLGLAVFVISYGLHVLDPTNVNWLLVEDWGQNFLGWDAFRREPWTWPLGKIQNLNWPEGTSLVFTDSLPILSILLKPLHSLLPDPFQFQGLWLLACLMLLPAFGYLLFRQLTGQPWVSALAAALLPLLPYVLNRDVHLSLMAFWLILWAWLLYFTPARPSTHFWFTVLLLLAAGINLYLLLMALVIWTSWWLRTQAVPLLRQHSFRAAGVSATLVAGPLVLLIPFMWALGYFVIPFSGARGFGFGFFSMNLNAWFNPARAPWSTAWRGPWSTVLPTLPWATAGQYEGFQYPGLGALVLVFVALGLLLRKRVAKPEMKRESSLDSGWRWLCLPCVFFTLAALSNKITFNQHELLSFDYPNLLAYIADTFRSSGRLFWPVNLILLALAVFVLSRRLSWRAAIGVLAVCFLIQLIDVHRAFPRRLNVLRSDFPRSSELLSTDWRRILESSSYVGFVPRDAWAWMVEGSLWRLVFMANRKGTPVNAMYVSRGDLESLSRANYMLLQQLSNDSMPSDASFIINQERVCGAPMSVRQRLRVLDGRFVLPAQAAGEVGVKLDPLIGGQVEIVDVSISRQTDLVEGCEENCTLLIAAADEASLGLAPEFVEQLEARGASIRHLGYRQAYAAIIDGKQTVLDRVGTDGPVEVAFRHGMTDVSAQSAGFDQGNYAHLIVNGVDCAIGGRGLSVLRIHWDRGLIERMQLDTHAVAGR
jgi:hypothetical protein